jgi:hypothetical protein
MPETDFASALAGLREELQRQRQTLEEISKTLEQMRTGAPYPGPLRAQRYWEETMEGPRYSEPQRLLKYGWKTFSQSEEDGLIHEIFHRIGEGERTFLEVGTGGGQETNTAALLLSNWRGAWIEADRPGIDFIHKHLQHYCDTGALKTVEAFVTRDNVNALISECAPPGELALLSIDVDGNDYWLWEAIDCVEPRAVVIEYNATWHPPLPFVVPYDPAFRWDGSNYFGASLAALERLGERKGYKLVGCCFSGVNAFFVREDLVQDRFAAPFTAENHYEPPRYWMLRPSGHPAEVGTVEIR